MIRINFSSIEKTSILKIIIASCVTLLFILALIFNRGITWMFRVWQNLTIDELRFTLSNEITGTNTDLITDFKLNVFPITVIFTLVMIVLFFILNKKRMFKRALFLVITVSVLLVSVTSIHAAERLDLSSHIRNRRIVSDFIGFNYVDPRNVELQFPEQKRNLIYIYLESVETTFVDQENGGAFTENIILELTELARQNIDFRGDDERINGGVSLPGATWTMGGMFAQTAGLPLNLPFDDNSMNTQDTFFPQLKTLGSILEDQGYNQALLVGSDATFGGRQLYYTTHGNFQIWDYYYALEHSLIPEDHRVWWGFEDWRLFEIGKQKLLELSKQDAPFHLTMLTVDTHATDGYLCELCDNQFDRQMANVFACSSKQVFEFVEWIKQQDFYENTTIVISADHPSMDGVFVADVPSDFQRRTFTTIINPAAEIEQPKWRREFSTMDLFPTTLAALGVDIPSNRLGLGVNLFSSEKTLIEEFGLEYVSLELQKNSSFIDQLNTSLVLENVNLYEVIDQFITVMPYDENIGILQIRVDRALEHLVGPGEFIAPVWGDGNPEQLIWFEDSFIMGNQFIINIDFSLFRFTPGTYQIEVHRRDVEGEHLGVWSYKFDVNQSK